MARLPRGARPYLRVMCKLNPASSIYHKQVVHIARTLEDIFSPLLSDLDTLGIVVPFRLGPHQLECIVSELADGPDHGASCEGRLNLKVLIQLVSEPLSRATGKLVHVLGESFKMRLLDPTDTIATPRHLGYAAGLTEGVGDASDSRCGDVESTSHRCHGLALVSDQFNDFFPSGVVDFFVLPSSDRWHGAVKSVGGSC